MENPGQASSFIYVPLEMGPDKKKARIYRALQSLGESNPSLKIENLLS